MSSSTPSSSPNTIKSSGSTSDIRTKGTRSSGPKVEQLRVSKSIQYGESFQDECLQLLREIKEGQEEFKGAIINMSKDIRAIGDEIRTLSLSRDIRMLAVIAGAGFVVNSYLLRSC